MLLQLLFYSFITASIAFTISESHLFASLRNLIKTKSNWLGKLVSCGFCLGYWVSFFLVALYPFKILSGLGLFDFFITTLAVAWLSAFQWIMLCWLMDLAKK
jgi:hypothetical protein